MGKLLRIPKVEVPKIEIKEIRVLDDFEGPTKVWSRSGSRFMAHEEGIDGTDDVMVIGPAFSEEGHDLKITPDLNLDLKKDPGVKYRDLGAATNGEIFRMNPAVTPFDHNLLDHDVMKGVFQAMVGVLPLPAPVSEALVRGLEVMAEEIIELDESDLIFEPDQGVVSGTIGEPAEGLGKDFMTAWKNAEGPVYLMTQPNVFDLTEKFDFTDVESFYGTTPSPQEVAPPWTQAEESWFIDPDALSRRAQEEFPVETTEIIPRAQIFSQGSKVEGVLQKIWKAWVKAFGFPLYW